MATTLSYEKGTTDGKNDLYNGHKVVAMPNSAFGGKSVRDVVSSQNIDDTDYQPTTPYRRRSRSSSRGPPASRSRDIVQEVYDRMGVNYQRGRPSMDTALTNKEAITDTSQASSQEPSRPSPRGRQPTRRDDVYESQKSTASARGRRENSSDSDRRCRSLSRGRFFKIWPPSHGPNNATEDPAILPTTETSNQKERANYALRRSMPQPPSNSFFRDQKHRHSYAESRDEERHEEPAQQDDERDAQSVVSVKSRISAYGGTNKGNTNARSVRRSYNNQSNKREQSNKRDHPPKVDIYAGVKAMTDGQDERDAQMSTAGSADASDAGAQTSASKRFSSANSVSRRSVKSGVVDTFLAAISPSKVSVSPRVSKSIPIVEINSDELNAGADMASLAASSVSGEDFAPSPKKRSSGRSVFSRNNGHSSNIMIERLIEERVQAHVAIATEGFEAQVRSAENRMEREHKTRINELERKTDKVNSVLSKLAPRKEFSVPGDRLKL